MKAVNPAAEGPVMDAAAQVPAIGMPPAAAVDGWDHEVMRSDGPAPVIVNPLAPDLAVCDWARAQAQCVKVLLDFLHLRDHPDPVEAETIGAIAHVHEQATSVLEELHRRLSLAPGEIG